MSSAPAIDANALTKEYPNGRGCRDVTITVGKGKPSASSANGAGKSTFVKMLVGLISPTGGKASILGHPLGSLEAKAKIGYLPELYRYQEWLTGEEVVRLHAKLSRTRKSVADIRIPQLLQEVGIGQRGRTGSSIIPRECNSGWDWLVRWSTSRKLFFSMSPPLRLIQSGEWKYG